MYKTLSNFSVFCFRNKVLVWMLLAVLSCFFMSSVSLAQQPTTIVNEVDIKDIQTFLHQLGYDPGPVDGIMGKKTAAAIQAFQRDHNLPVDGEPSEALVEALKQAQRPPEQEQELPSAQPDLTTMSPSELYVRGVQFEAQGEIEQALTYYHYLMETYPDHDLAVKAAERVTVLSMPAPQPAVTPVPQPTPTPLPQVTEEEMPTPISSPTPAPAPKPRKKRRSLQEFSVARRFGIGILSNFLNLGLGPSVEFWATENLGIMGSLGALFDYLSYSIRGNFLLKNSFYIGGLTRPYFGIGYAKVQGPEESYGGYGAEAKAETEGSGVEVFGGLLHQATWLHDKVFIRGEFCYSTVELESTVTVSDYGYYDYEETVTVSTDYSAFTINLGITYLF